MARHRYDTHLTHRCGALRREAAVAACMLALLFNLIAGLWLASRPVMGLEGSRTAWTLCLTGGDVASADATQSTTPKAASHPQCIFCLPLLSGSARPPDGAALRPKQRPPDTCRPYRSQRSAAHTAPSGRPMARGPPVAPMDCTSAAPALAIMRPRAGAGFIQA